MGKLRKRMSFSRIAEFQEMPDLIEVQRVSYEAFLQTGLREVLAEISPIVDHNGKLELSFVNYVLDKPKNSVARCRERDMTYAAPLRFFVSLFNRETGEVKEGDVFMGEFPIMTEHGTFIINGAERVAVSQLVRSPGVYYSETIDKSGQRLYASQIIPNRGAWIEFETDSNNVISVRLDRNRKMPITLLLRAVGYGTDSQILTLLGEDERLVATLQKGDGAVPYVADERALKDFKVEPMPAGALVEIYKKQKPGEPVSLESAYRQFNNYFFDPKRYDLMRVGRYKFNKKLALSARIANHKAAEDIVHPATGEVLAAAGDTISIRLAREIQQAGVNAVMIDVDGTAHKVVGNYFADARAYLPFDPTEVGINEWVHLPTLQRVMAESTEETLKENLRANLGQLVPKHIVPDDMVASISYLLGLPWGIGSCDDIDHLGNRRLRSVGELLQNQIRIGMSRLERVVRERMAIQDAGDVRPGDLINIRPVTAAIKEFFGSSQLSQFMDQPNPLAELTHKRRLSALGPGGLNRERASFEVRDVHYSHYARICPIETPEGPNIGLIGSLASYARVNEYGFIEAPYRPVDPETHCVQNTYVYMSADEEDLYRIGTAHEPLDENGAFVHDMIQIRNRAEYIEVPREKVDFIDVSPRQVVSVATAMVPFLENDDATRALMGSNMQRQAVPLLTPEAPIVATGMEYRAGYDSGVCLVAHESGVVEKVDGNHILLRDELGEAHDYKLSKFVRSNQGTCINQRPLVSAGQKVEAGDLLADGPSTELGEIGLGRNALIGFMTWEGYNYEDAVLLNERLVKWDIYTSIHIESQESEARETKQGPEEITRDIPNTGEEQLRDLDEDGIIRIGAEVHTGDILVGKVTPKGETDLTAEDRLLRAIFGEKSREVRDTSLRVPHGEGGIVVDVRIFTRENKDELAPGVNKMVQVFIAQKRKIQVGDKMAGRHGNKGVVSRILHEEDMPFLPDGTPLDIVLNPMGVPSRMNLGQVLEVHLGMAAKALGWHIATPVFDGATYGEIEECIDKAAETDWGKKIGINRTGKFTVYDGRTGDAFEHPVTVGIMYFLKLHHLVDDKMHARSTGPYSLVTQQPLGGKAQFGGQRFGEMEVWALEAYGAANTLQEILTFKSDDTVGRVKTYEAIVKGQNIPNPGVPESFRVLIKELQSLCLDIRVLDPDRNIIEIPELDPEDTMQGEQLPMRDERQPAADEPMPELEEGIDMDEPVPEIPSTFGELEDAGFLPDDFQMDDADQVDPMEDMSFLDLGDLGGDLDLDS